MNDNYLITVIGKQTVDGESDSIEAITSGDCRIEDNGDITITYPEFSEENPTVRTDTTVSLRGNILTIERRGQMSSRLILEKGRRHQCLYETPMGQMFIGIFTDGIEVELDKSGGDIRASYQLDFNQNVVSYNEFYINIKEKDLK